MRVTYRQPRTRSRLLLSSVLLTAVGGCTLQLIPPTPSILQGTWRLDQVADESLQEVFWTFDAQGNLTEIRYVINNITITETPTLATTTVALPDVTVTTQFGTYQSTFAGAINDTNTVIAGNVSFKITFGPISVEVNQGAATLTRQ